MNCKNTISALLIFLVSLLPTATTTIVPALDVSQIASEATLIAIGQVMSIEETARGEYEIGGRLIPARQMVAYFRVDRVLKGEADAEVSISFFSPDELTGYAQLAPDQFGMFFLRSTPQGLATVSPYYPFIVALREDCASKGSGISRVVAELGCVVHSSTTTIRQRAEGIRALGA